MAWAPSFPGFFIAEFDSGSQIIITDAMGDTRKVVKGLHMPEKEALLFLGGEGHGKGPSRVTEPHNEELHLLTTTSHLDPCLPPICLGILTWLEFQGNKDFGKLPRGHQSGDGMANSRLRPLISFVSKHFKDPACGVVLFEGQLLILR